MEDKEIITIENRLKEIRKQRHLSQEELADALGVSRQSVIALEQGKSMPSLPLAVSMCRFFNAAFEEIFEFEREMEQEFENNFNPCGVKIKIINPDEEPGGKENVMGDKELRPWKPFREAVSLRDAIDRLFEDSIITPGRVAAGMPKIDILDKKEAVIVKAELPGVNEEDIDVEISENVMTITGEKKEEREKEEEGYFYKESHTGSFSRSFTLPSDVIAESATADMKNGILTITVPKVEPKKAQKVKINKK